MNRKLGRLLRPGMGAYFFVMAAFCAAALLVGHYWLAAGEMTVTVVTFLLYVLDRTRRERKIQQYIQSASNTLEASSGGEAPLPAVMVRLGDGDPAAAGRGAAGLHAGLAHRRKNGKPP